MDNDNSTPRYTGDYSDEDYREWHREFGPGAIQASATAE